MAHSAPEIPDEIANNTVADETSEKHTPQNKTDVSERTSSSVTASAATSSTDRRVTMAFGGYTLSFRSNGKSGGEERISRWYSCLKCGEEFDNYVKVDAHKADCEKSG
jgi:hypothetical protein